MIIKINKSLNTQLSSYENFASLQNKIINSNDNTIDLIINNDKSFSYTFWFLIGTLPFLANKYNKNIKIYCENTENAAAQTEDATLCRAPRLIEKADDIFDIVTEIINEAPVKMDLNCKDIFISKIGEMFNNAFEHSCGKVFGTTFFHNQKQEYTFTCYDTGIGIPCKVISSNANIITQTEAFKWAMTDGNSTVRNGVPRGLGLGLLKSFVTVNEGAVRICSNNIFYSYSKNGGEIYRVLRNNFYGTLFEMDIIADNNGEYILN